MYVIVCHICNCIVGKPKLISREFLYDKNISFGNDAGKSPSNHELLCQNHFALGKGDRTQL